MASDYFDFRQFRVYHDRCAQKVGTDGVVLGSWVSLQGANRILDIGTGSGLIALMLAQRAPWASVVGVDVDAAAVGQARENVSASPFVERIEIIHGDVRDFCKSNRSSFDCIVCNPPFYTEDTLPPDSLRALARNASSLPFDDLINSACGLLSSNGSFSVMLPMSCRDSFTVSCEASGLHLVRECVVKTVERKPAKRVLITYSKNRAEIVDKECIVLQDGNEKSEAYKCLARDFYL